MKFEITSEQAEKVDNWLKSEIYPKVIAKQKEVFDDFVAFCHEDGYPYEGAIGGGLTYSFTPTSVGVVVKAAYGEDELDLTEWENW